MATTKELIDQLLASGLTPDDITKRVRSAKVKGIKSYFTKFLVEGNTQAAVLTVNDWRGIREFIKEPPTADYNPGGPAFADILDDTDEAIKSKDAAALIENLLLIYKVVRRA